MVTFSGGNAAFIALASVLYAQTYSATLVAAAAMASFGVPALVSPFAGLLSDRFDRRRVMICSELCGALCFGVMALVNEPGALIGLRVAAALAAAPFVPATTAALPKLVGIDAQVLARANAELATAGWVGLLVGPALAGALLGTVGGDAVFVFNALTFVASAVLIASIRADFRPSGRVALSLSEFAAGGQGLVRHPILRPITVAYGVMFIGLGVTVPAEVAISAAFGAGSLGFAAITFAFALGGVVGAQVSRWMAGRLGQTAVLALAAAGLSVGLLWVGVAPTFVVVLAGMTLGGLCQGLWQVAQELLIQRTVPAPVLGRVLASSGAVEQGGIACGLLLAGFVVAAIGPAGAFLVASAACAIGTMLITRALWTMRIDLVPTKGRRLRIVGLPQPSDPQA